MDKQDFDEFDKDSNGKLDKIEFIAMTTDALDMLGRLPCACLRNGLHYSLAVGLVRAD